MRYVFRLGPIEFEDDSRNFYLALGDTGVDSEFADEDVAALVSLARRSADPLVCEPALAKASRTLGLEVKPMPDPATAQGAWYRLFQARLSEGRDYRDRAEFAPLLGSCAGAVRRAGGV